MENSIDIRDLSPEDAEYVKKLVDVLKDKPTNGSSAANDVNESNRETPRTQLGAELWAIRTRIEQSGVPLLSPEEIEAEVAERRGEKYP